MEKKKVGFASGIGFILAAAGSAVGLGNLWGFPYKTSQNGGAAFVLIYIACVLLIGFVTMLSEIYLGRRSQANPMTAYKMVNKNLGWCGLVAIMIPAFDTGLKPGDFDAIIYFHISFSIFLRAQLLQRQRGHRQHVLRQHG